MHKHDDAIATLRNLQFKCWYPVQIGDWSAPQKNSPTPTAAQEFKSNKKINAFVCGQLVSAATIRGMFHFTVFVSVDE